MKLKVRRLVLICLFVVMMPVLFLFGLKLQSSWEAQPVKKYWSPSAQCYIARYIPSYQAVGMVGRALEMFSSQYFYRVYTKDGELLKTSEWYLWMREGNAGVAPEFQGEMVLYPGADGWESWMVPECR